MVSGRTPMAGSTIDETCCMLSNNKFKTLFGSHGKHSKCKKYIATDNLKRMWK